MKLYFCPHCGRSYDSSECIEEGVLRRCPMCAEKRCLLLGRVLTGAGMAILFISTTILGFRVFVPGIVFGGGMCVLGFVRSLQYRSARRRYDAELDDSDESDIDESVFDDDFLDYDDSR